MTLDELMALSPEDAKVAMSRLTLGELLAMSGMCIEVEGGDTAEDNRAIEATLNAYRTDGAHE